MKRILLFILLMALFAGLPVATVQAQRQQVLDPGCSPEMWGYLKDQADATRARNKAYERELLHRQPSTLYLTCFDQAMAVSSKLGLIFSDNVYPNPPPANTLVFPTPAYPDWGAAQPTMAMNLDSIVNPIFNNWLNAVVPAPAYFNFLPQWREAYNMLTPIALFQQEALMAIMAYQMSDQAQAAAYTSLVQSINSLVKSLSTTPLQGLPPMNIQYTVLVTNLQMLVGMIQSTRGATMPGLLAMLQGAVSSFQDTCTRADDLWDTLDPTHDTSRPGVFYPPEAEQYWAFTPYYPLKDLLGAPGTTPSPPATPDFVQELANASDSDALRRALAVIGESRSDLESLRGNESPLGYVGNSPLWPAPPTFMPKEDGTLYSAHDVIEQM